MTFLKCCNLKKLLKIKYVAVILAGLVLFVLALLNFDRVKENFCVENFQFRHTNQYVNLCALYMFKVLFFY